MRNAQGDITKIIDGSGNVVVEYAYDAWGLPLGTTGSMAATFDEDNPFRYRGYFYDKETGNYYLNQRYYNPAWGRFINADDVLGETGTLLDHNLFAYCANNPIMNIDSSGQGWFDFALGFLAAAVVAVVVVVAAPVIVPVLAGVGIAASTATVAAAGTMTLGVAIAGAGACTIAGAIDSGITFTRDPDPFGRPGQKKQQRELKQKARRRDDWEDRGGRRRPQPPPKHSPSNKGHRKYDFILWKYEQFEKRFQ